jgi:hypothetical protein
MPIEKTPTLIIVCACGAILYAAEHQHHYPNCVAGKDWCQVETPRLVEGHEELPTPMDTGDTVISQISTAASVSTASLNLVNHDFFRLT